MGLRAKKPFWQDAELDDGGFSTVGVALALLISLSLVFAGAQVYRVQSVAAEIQEVADAAALGIGQVAEGDSVPYQRSGVSRRCGKQGCGRLAVSGYCVGVSLRREGSVGGRWCRFGFARERY